MKRHELLFEMVAHRGIDDIKEAISAGMSLSLPENPVKITYLAKDGKDGSVYSISCVSKDTDVQEYLLSVAKRVGETISKYPSIFRIVEN